jgi:hypothetical protein
MYFAPNSLHPIKGATVKGLRRLILVVMPDLISLPRHAVSRGIQIINIIKLFSELLDSGLRRNDVLEISAQAPS